MSMDFELHVKIYHAGEWISSYLLRCMSSMSMDLELHVKPDFRSCLGVDVKLITCNGTCSTAAPRLIFAQSQVNLLQLGPHTTSPMYHTPKPSFKIGPCHCLCRRLDICQNFALSECLTFGSKNHPGLKSHFVATTTMSTSCGAAPRTKLSHVGRALKESRSVTSKTSNAP
jgi:hypothetical protein